MVKAECGITREISDSASILVADVNGNYAVLFFSLMFSFYNAITRTVNLQFSLGLGITN